MAFNKLPLMLRGINGTSGSLQRDFAIINQNLNRELEKVKHRTNKGLLLAAIEVRRSMENVPPLIPVEYGNLRASWFITTKKSADPSSKSLQVRSASFKAAQSPKILKELKEGHKKTLAQADVTMAQYPIGVMMGFSAFYSAPVHEMVGSSSGSAINWSRPGSGPKFFQAAIYRNLDNIVNIVKTNAQIIP
jgi:hypothetical protein